MNILWTKLLKEIIKREYYMYCKWLRIGKREQLDFPFSEENVQLYET